MLDRINKLLNEELLNENGTVLQLKCATPRLMGAKYFPMLKAQKVNIQMNDDGATAMIKISTIDDLINIMKILEKDVVFEKNGDTIKIL